MVFACRVTTSAIPCSVHGRCCPDALQWVQRLTNGKSGQVAGAVKQVHILMEKYPSGIAIVSSFLRVSITDHAIMDS